MDYAELQAAFLGAPAEGQTPPRIPDHPARRLRDAAEPIATIGFWGRPAYDRLAELGLDFLTGYVWARTAPLGEPSAPVVVAAFGVFEPSLVTSLYEQARALCSRAQVLAAREAGAVASLHDLLPDLPTGDVAAAVALLRRATDVAAADVAGRPLFAGLTSLPWPANPLGQLWHATNLLREYRGDVHQAANVAAGLTGVQMNLVTEYWIGWEPTAYAGSRGWAPEVMAAADDDLVERGWVADGALTARGQRQRDDIEAQTDAALERVLFPVGDELPALTDLLDRWSAAIVAGGAAPPDPYKRVSG
ncbi:hypothetical protein SAMN05661080_03573 [Modestobacter sp. DSM 44400]|uniref:SCO6745 family protein n=1 Tax=Modestobacter sp. DSM 44400 TaxID=1550230 RepID=UPI0008950DC8|nr:hypothetical protein [Modestobacter sp. DSM 44400]SDY46794.1 hypothetical protein SAMN05661080_03573 [Modestobacter sp. DSM 44400]